MNTRKSRLKQAVYRALCRDGCIIRLKRCKGYRGIWSLGDGITEICVDPKKDIVVTMMHELMHEAYPYMSETEVEANAQWLASNMSLRELRTFIRMVGNKLT